MYTLVMNTDPGTADRLSDHLDSVATDVSTRSHDRNPAVAAMVEHFFAADDAPAPTPGLVAQIWEVLPQQALAIRQQMPHLRGRIQLRLPRQPPAADF